MAPRPNLPRLSRRGFLAAAPTALAIEAGAVPAQPLPELARVWGEARDAAGSEVKRRLRTPNGYDITVTAALGIVQRLLGGPAPAGGYYTPSKLMGADYVLSLPGVRLD